MAISVKLITALFASLFLIIWHLTFNGRNIVNGELFRCEMVMNVYNRNSPCKDDLCIELCGHKPLEPNSDKCLSVLELEDGDEYEELFLDGEEEADHTTAGDDGIDRYYKHMVGCCNSQLVSELVTNDDGDESPSGSEQKQARKLRCSRAFFQEQYCVDVKCIKDCDDLNFQRGRCLKVEEIDQSKKEYPATKTIEDVDQEEPVGSSASDEDDDDSNSDSKACGCYPKLVGDIYKCSRAFWHYTEKNPCTETKCFDACIGAGDSFGRCLKRTLIVVVPHGDYGFTTQDELLEVLDDSDPNKKACCCDPEYV